jgi:prepilin-type N-terminal cleavage/methylation domain-containing protein
MNWMQRVVARRYSAEEGMTLIELLVVVLILGILAAIVVVGIGAFQNTGEHEACVTTVGEVESANAAYYAKNQTWAADISALVGSTNYLKTTPKAAWGIAVSGGPTVTNTCPS